jgi:DNA-binding transcriptional regulator/RsmH inhibitor MraZ
VIAEEFAVLDRAGRVQLPREFVTTLGLRERVRLELEPDHVGVWQAQTGRAGNAAQRDEEVDG